MNRRGATDIYFLGLSVTFLVVGAIIILMVSSAYRDQNEGEEIGFRQSAVIEAYHNVEDIRRYAHTAALQATREAFVEFLEAGLREKFVVDGDLSSPCGFIGTYTAWNTEEEGCYSIFGENVNPVLAQYVTNQLIKSWDHPLLDEPPRYTYSFSSGKDGLMFIGSAQEEVIIPIVGVKDASVKAGTRALTGGSDTQSIKADFAADTTLSGVKVKPDNDRRLRRTPVSGIVLHYTVTSNLDQTEDIFLMNGLSIHYIVGRDGSITQMVPESEVAYHAGGCLDRSCVNAGGSNCENKYCALTDMNDKTIGIEIVNWGFARAGNANADLRAGTSGCPEGYIEAARNCSYASYNNYPINGYTGKQNCEGTPKDRCWEIYPDEQKDAVFALVKDIASRHNIAAEKIITHEEIKAEKSDPGPAFPWDDLRQAVRAQGPSSYVPPPPDLGNRGLQWPAGDYRISSCDESLGIIIKEDDPVYAMGDGRVLSVDDCETCEGKVVTLKHDDKIYTRYSGLKITNLEKDDEVNKGKKLGSASGEIIVSVFTSGKDLSNNKGALPLCFLSQSILLQLRPITGACEEFATDGSVVLDRTNQKVMDACAGVFFQGVTQKSCFSQVLSADQIDTSSAKVEETRRGLELQGLMEEVFAAAHEEDIPPAFLFAIITQESIGADPKAISPKGAAGIMQFTSTTAKLASVDLKGIVACCTKKESDEKICHKREVAKCPLNTDERFDPQKAIPAAARYIKAITNNYKQYTDKWYFVAQEYNAGDTKVLKGIEECKLLENTNDPSYACVSDAIGPLWGGQEKYGRDVMQHYVAWGGTATGLNVDISCDDVTVKHLGSIRFLPHFAVPVPPLNEQLQALSEWARGVVATADDELPETFAHMALEQSLDGWTLSGGFCEEKYDQFIALLMKGLQECTYNQQEDCSCPVLPSLSEDILENGDYTLVFHEHGVIELWRGFPADNKLLAETVYGDLTNVYYEFAGDEDVRDVEEVLVVFSVRDNDYADSAFAYVENGQILSAKHKILGFFKLRTDELWGLYDMPSDDVAQTTCLPSERLYAVCSQSEHSFEVAGKSIKPSVKFGLTLTDEYPPTNPTNAILDADEFGNLFFSFKSAGVADLSGVLVYCAEGSFEDNRHYYPVRYTIEELRGDMRLPITECNGEAIKKVPGTTYVMRVRSYDYGANENDGDVMCGNMASFTFTNDYMSYMGGGSSLLFDAVLASAMGCGI